MVTFPRKSKQPATQPRDRQRLPADAPRQAAFSYYANRLPEAAQEQPHERLRRRQPTVLGRLPSVPGVKRRMGLLPFILLLIMVVGVVARLMYLGGTPRVVVVAGSTAANNSLRDTKAYAKAAQAALQGSLLNRTKLTVDNEGVSSKVLQQFPELEAVSVSTQFLSDRPVISVVPAQPKLVLKSGTDAYAINADGVAYGVNNGASQDIVTVVDESGAAATIGKQALPSSTVSFVQMVAFQMQHGGQKVSSFTLPKGSAYELDMHLAGKSYVVRFNLESDAREQSGALLATLQHFGTVTPRQYIDVRVPGRIYYK